MKSFELGLGTMLLRYYLMMMIIIAAGFIGEWWLAILSLPVFLSTILGISFGKNQAAAKVRTLRTTSNKAKKVG